ncbi:MAG TPA: BTAD domain-containing putative transcriptional regulator [Gemmatimonadaceae bacterium]|nr:BTAD domain-containing putative transcriptional regulator [Gemmatimonadaceae bacterium]
MQRLRLFGGVAIELDGAPLAGRAVQRRRLALLALLAVARARGGTPGSGLTRDKLIAWLWPSADGENGRRYLSDSVYRINDALGAEVIAAEGDTLRLDTALLPSDVIDFRDALAAGDQDAAVALYAGPFVDGFFVPDAPEFERWVDTERNGFASQYAQALEALAEQAAARGERTQAADWLRRLAAHDPYNSRVAILLMQALANAGQRAAAIQHARVHEALLRNELELEPDPQVATLADRLREEPERSFQNSSEPRAPAVLPVPPADPAVVEPAARAPATLSTPTPARRSRWLYPAMALALAAAVALFLIMRPDAPASGELHSIAVLPFANLSAEPDNEYFSDGMTEELIATLGRVEGLTVASRTSAFAFKNRREDVREIARQLGVDAIVEGSVRKSGNALRITAQLVNATNGYRLWSDAFDRQAGDAFAVQEEIARAIVTRLRGALSPTATVAQQGGPVNPQAYDLYLRGRFAWHQRTGAGLRQAVEHLSRAVALDPDYARAHAGLADAYAVSAFYDILRPRDAYPRALASAARALELDPSLAAAHATLGYVRTYFELDWTAAEASFKRAIALDPSYSIGHQWYGNLLTASRRFAEAEREMRLAQEADPLSLVGSAALCWTWYYAGRYEDAVQQCERTLALDPRYTLAHLWGGWALEELGRLSEARAWIGKAVELSPESDQLRLSLAHVLASSPATRDSARGIVADVEARHARGQYVPAYEVAQVYLALGDRARAWHWLDRAVEDKSHSRALLRVDPQIASLRNHPRFASLLK